MQLQGILQNVATKTKTLKDSNGDKQTKVFIQAKIKSTDQGFIVKNFGSLNNMITSNSNLVFDNIGYTPNASIILTVSEEEKYTGYIDKINTRVKDGLLIFDYTLNLSVEGNNEYLLTCVKNDEIELDVEFK